MVLESHPTAEALKGLLPLATVAGGSFSSWLPDPSTLTLVQCKDALKDAQEEATLRCIESLLVLSGLDSKLEVPRRQGGDRLWPEGYTGSLTHKPTLILGALKKKTSYTSIGIDLEIIEEQSLDKDLVAPEGLPVQSNEHLGSLIAFSAKEAVFKAQYPMTQRRIEFSDVRIEWDESQGNLFRGKANVHGFSPCAVQVVLVKNWMVSAATY